MESIESSNRIYEGRILNLRVDVLRKGQRVYKREIVEHRGAVGVVAETKNKELILVRQYRHAVGEELIEIPAGTLEPGESPEECAKRELIEETGYEAEELSHVGTLLLAPGYSTERLHLYKVKVGERKAQNVDVDEEIEVLVIPLEDVFEMVRRGEIRDAKSLAGILLVYGLG